MGIITGGYDGNVDEVQFAGLFPRYSVVGADDFKATTQAGDRIVSIGNGTALGPGTIDTATNLPTIQFTAAATGATRWDLVVLRRDWQPPGGVSEIKIIQGGATEAYPAVGTALTQWNRRPGIMDDQPLYLQQVNGTLLGTRIDLRCWRSDSGLVALHDKAKTYLEKPGAEVLIGGIKHRYVPGANNVFGWTTQDVTQSAADVSTFGPGWAALTAGHKPRLFRSGGMVHLIGAMKRTGGSTGNILTVPAAYKPANASSTFVGAGTTSNGIAYELLLTNGELSIEIGYATGTDNGVNTVFPVSCSWPLT